MSSRINVSKVDTYAAKTYSNTIHCNKHMQFVACDAELIYGGSHVQSTGLFNVTKVKPALT